MDEDRTVGLDIVALIAHGHAETTAVSNQLIANFQREINEMRDVIQGVLEELGDLYRAPYTPSAHAVLGVVAPLTAYDTAHRYSVEEEN